MEFSGTLRGMADKAFPAWPAEQLQDLLRNQFIQGVLSSSVQLALMKEEPKTLDDALKLACKHEMVETAQKHLQMLRQKEVVASTDGESSNSELVTAMLGANCEFAQFINCAAHYVNPRSAQQFINCCANCESYYARSVYKLRKKCCAICE